MKKGLLVAAMAALALATPGTSRAHTYDRDDSDHPLRLVAYLIHPIGVAIEYAILRPVHCLVSMNHDTNNWFGHESHEQDWWQKEHGAGAVTVKVETPTGPDGQPLDPSGEAAVAALGFQVVYFDYDRAELRADQLAALDQNLKILQANPNVRVVLEGHCDERGTTEYNLALGERRSKAVTAYFTKNGVDASRVTVLSKGEEAPVDAGHDEAAWSKNRRVETKGQ